MPPGNASAGASRRKGPCRSPPVEGVAETVSLLGVAAEGDQEAARAKFEIAWPQAAVELGHRRQGVQGELRPEHRGGD